MRQAGIAGVFVRVFFLLGLLALRTDAASDPAADFLVDISELAGEPCAIRISTDRGYWQLPAEQIRKGYGIGLFAIQKNTTNNCEARIYVEVEDIGSVDIDAAAAKAVEDLPSLLESRQTKIEGEVKLDKRSAYKLGATTVQGCMVRYSVKVLNADPVTVDPATALIFVHKKALVTITVENYASSTVDHYSRFLKTVSIEKMPAKAECRLKMVDATGGTYQYLEMPLPPKMTTERSDQLEGNAVGFCRSQEDGKPSLRIRVAKSETDRPMEPKEEAEFRHSDLMDAYQLVSNLQEMEIGGTKCWICTGQDQTRARLAVVYFRPRKVMWTWTLESIGADDKRFEADLAAFKAGLKKLQCWASR